MSPGRIIVGMSRCYGSICQAAGSGWSCLCCNRWSN